MIKKICRILLKVYHGEFADHYNEKDLLNEEMALKKLISHAYKHVPYYRKIFEQIGIIAKGSIDLERFKEIPVLTKDIIRKHWNELTSSDYGTRRWRYNTSGGSTGEPLRLIQDDLYDKHKEYTNQYYYKTILGINEKKAKKVILWGAQKDVFKGTRGLRRKVVNWIEDFVLLNSFQMTQEDMREYVCVINRYKPDLIRGYAGSLFELCKFIEGHKLTLHKPKVVVCSSETLNEDVRSLIERVFGMKIHDFYGSREVAGIAGECDCGLMHVFSFFNKVEVLNMDNNSIGKEGHGKVIVTNLYNYAMPLIRYEIGDMAVKGPDVCHCGSPLPTLKKVTGRMISNFVTKERAVIDSGYFEFLFFHKKWIRKFQIIQEDYKRIRVKIVLNGDADMADREGIGKNIRSAMGEDCKVIWEFVDDIQPSPTGKHITVKSLVYK